MASCSAAEGGVKGVEHWAYRQSQIDDVGSEEREGERGHAGQECGAAFVDLVAHVEGSGRN
ncbi:hypothetical protein GCM10022255_100970 [Dactylosporangium darangshiense]|uniref:Uncharacterized protein n=1 Tax=Dactylosporangium darangshiense TaxID=579108 RepID=A0ABP8DRV1_9ACTN